jgi:hypothetical protein
VVVRSVPISRRASLRRSLDQIVFVVAAWVDTRLTWLSLAGSVLVVGALYGRAVRYAFFFDDTYDLTRTEGRGYLSLLTSSEGYSYYRPIPFLIWKFLRGVQGHYDQATLHTLPLVAHALAGWLLFLLLRRLGAGAWALVPALLFLTFPFDYQAVAICGTLFHPLAGAAMLATLVAYQSARVAASSRPRVAWHALALAATVVALWSHESGVVVAPLVIGLEGVILWNLRERRPSLWVLPHLALTGLFVWTWYVVDKAPSPESTTLAELRPKGLYFLQGFTYPFSAQLVWLDERLGWAPGVLQTGLAAIALGIAAYAFAGWRAGKRGRGLALAVAVPALAIGAAITASLPSLARLSYAYVADSPRLLYLVGIGAAIFWGLIPSIDFRHRRVTLAWRIGSLLLLGGIVIQSWRFVDVRMTMFERGSYVVSDIVTAGEEFRGEQVVFVNAPSWFSQDHYEYPIGHFGVQLMPSYIGLDRVVYTSSHISAYTEAASVSWEPDVSAGVYPFGPHGPATPPEQLDALLRDGREVITVNPDGSGFDVRDVGRLLPGQAEPRPDFPGALGSTVWLSSARTSFNSDRLVVLFQWHVVAPLPDDANAVIELRDGSGHVVARYVGYPLGGVSAPRLWLSGDRVDDSVAFERPAPGEYTVWAGMTRVSDGTPLPAQVGAPNTPVAENMLEIGSVTVR